MTKSKSCCEFFGTYVDTYKGSNLFYNQASEQRYQTNITAC